MTKLLLAPLFCSLLCGRLAAQEDQPAQPPMQEQEVAAAAPAAGAEAAAPVPQPEAAPAPQREAPAAEPAVTPAQDGSVSAEWEFFLNNSSDKSEEILQMLLEGIDDWLARNPDGAGQYIRAGLRYRLGDHKGALIDLVHHFYEFPAGGSSEEAKKLFQEILDKKADKKAKPGLLELAKAVPAGDTADRLYAMLDLLPVKAGAAFYEPIMEEYRAFLNRYPGRPGNDKVAMDAADMHLNMKEYLKARFGYEKVIAVYPGSPRVPRAKLFLAVILADNLKEYDRALKVFRDITRTLPGTDQAKAAYARLPELAEKRDQHQLAVEVYEEIIRLYPDTPEAHKAYLAAARVQREELDKFPEAVAVLSRLADAYKDSRGAEALMLAAEIHRKDLKDQEGEIKIYDRLAADFPRDPLAPKALLAAGEIFEKSKNFEKARAYYSAVTEKYQEDPLAKKAQKRLDGLLAR